MQVLNHNTTGSSETESSYLKDLGGVGLPLARGCGVLWGSGT